MDYKEIEAVFKDNSANLDLLLENYKDSFDRLDYYSKALKNGILNNGQDCVFAINEITGIYMSLKVVLYRLIAEKENLELRYYFVAKDELLKEKGRLTDVINTFAKKQAALNVSGYRRVISIFEGYSEASTQAIQALQSILKFITSEIMIHKS